MPLQNPVISLQHVQAPKDGTCADHESPKESLIQIKFGTIFLQVLIAIVGNLAVHEICEFILFPINVFPHHFNGPILSGTSDHLDGLPHQGV